MKRFFPLLIVLLFLVSCTDELDQIINGSRTDVRGSKTVFQASTEGPASPETKVYADENLKVLWNADDRISIFNKTTFNYQFAFTGDDGDTAGSFEEIPTSDFITGTEIDNIYAVYPYDRKNKLNHRCVLTVTLPSEQAYKESSFGIGANTMVAASSGNFLAFKNVGGYLNLRLYGDDVSVSRITIKGNNGEKIAGKASIEMPLGGVPTVTMDNSATDEVSVVCNPAVKIGSDANNYTDFWFVIPPVYFSLGFTITVTDDKGGVFERATSKALTINRNTLEWMAALKVVPDYTNANVQFEDANFKAYCVENFDKDGDGEISMAEANAVTTITVNPEIVASLKGIEYFKNLQSLTCRLNWSSSSTDANGKRHYYNANKEEIFSLLTSLDLSNNLALTSLNCSSNQLTSLDVSSNTALIQLYCGDNQLTSLDVSYNTALTTLNCRYNQLTALDVSNITELKTLTCSSNQLTSLDVSHNTALTSLNCSYNQLTSLDMSNNTALTSLNCSYNQLTSLDVSNNTELQSLNCSSNQLTSLDVSHCAELTDLNCSSNQLTSLDVSHNTALTSLSCGSNQLTGLDVSHNTELRGLSCNSNQLTSLDLSNNTALTSLYCYSNQLTSLDVCHNTALIWLYCYSNQLTSLDVSHNTGMTVLNCRNNQLTNLDISNNTALSELDCRGNMSGITIYIRGGQVFSYFYHDDSAVITEKGTPIPAGNVTFEDSAFKAYCVENFDKDGDGEISYGEALIVTYIDCDNKGIQSLSGIECFTNLTQLYCDSNQLTSLDVSHCAALTDLSCGSNQLTSLDVSHNTALSGLYCYSNQLTSLDVSNITVLTRLDCSDNQLTRLDVSNNTELQSLYCYYNQLTSLDVSRNTALTNLNCRSNQLTSLDVSHNTELTYLNCYSNQLTSLDVSHNTALTSLYCYSNRLTSLDVSSNLSLTSLWCYQNKLASLDVSNNVALTYLYCHINQLTSLDISNNPALLRLWCYSNQLTSLDVSSCMALTELLCSSNPSLTEIWLKTGQDIGNFSYDTSVATIKYKD